MRTNRTSAAHTVSEEISALIEIMDETNQRLEELTAGQIDTVADRKGRPYLLRRTQEKLRRREASRQAAILNALPAYIALLDMKGCILSVNDAWRLFEPAESLPGPGHAVGLSFLQICTEVRDGLREVFSRLAIGIGEVLGGATKSFTLDYAGDATSGQDHYLITVTPLADENPGGAVLMYQNVTAERRMRARLSESELMFRQMSESIGDVFFLRSPDSDRFLYISPAYEGIWGRSCASLCADPGSWISAIHPDDRVAIAEATLDSAKTGGFEIEHRVVRPDGSIRRVRIRGFPVHDEHDTLIRVAGVATDVTELRETELALQRTHDNLTQSNRDLQDFAHVASHDLQEPLRKIMMFSDRLLRIEAVTRDAQARDCAERSIVAARRMRLLVSGLLELSELSPGARPSVQVDLQQTAIQVMDDLSELIAQTGARIEVDHLPTIEGDATALRQIFQNLIANALKFRRDGVTPIVSVSAAATLCPDGEAAWTITVQYNGVGFEQKYADRIFSVFQRLHQRHEFEGAGIGLSIVRRCAQLHRGSVAANAEVGVGARFDVILPQRQPAIA